MINLFCTVDSMIINRNSVFFMIKSFEIFINRINLFQIKKNYNVSSYEINR